MGIFETTDPNELMETVGQVMVPPRVERRCPGRFAAQVRMADFGPVGSMVIKINNANVQLPAGSGQYLVHAPIDGAFETDQGTFTANPLPDRADVTAPDRPFHLRTDSSTFWVFRFDEYWLQDLGEQLNQGKHAAARKCHGVLDTRSPLGRQFMQSANLIWSDLHSNRLGPKRRTAAARELATDLLQAMQAANVADADAYDATPAALVKTVDWIHENLGEPISRADLCDVSGLHVRTLTRGMQQKYGVSPMQYVREQRLNAIRQKLLHSSPEVTSVTRIAEDFGIGHLGRFAHSYQQRFKERATDTLHR